MTNYVCMFKAFLYSFLVYSIISSRPCRQITAGKCPQLCSKEYQPVCAEFEYELKEFPNQCELQKEICLTNKGMIISNLKGQSV